MKPRKKASLGSGIRAFSITSKPRAEVLYLRLMKLALSNLPDSGVKVYVALLLYERMWLDLLVWAASVPAVLGTVEETLSMSQFVALIKKYPHRVPGIKEYARDAAAQKFEKAELRCKRYNIRFRHQIFREDGPHSDTLRRAKKWIAYVLGEIPNLPAIYAQCDFGPGASIGVGGDTTSAARKFCADTWSVTPQALPYVCSALSVAEPRIWEMFKFPEHRQFCYDYDQLKNLIETRSEKVQYNNVTFVPKTTLVDRTIAVEPLWNGYVQKGIDLFMRSRLKRVGIDLSDQTVNQVKAFEGSRDHNESNPYVTLDLSAASDTVSSEFVRYMLPPDWFDLLNHVRSPAYKIKGNPTEMRYEKFVSMGNGFCFPLETLLFASVCFAVSSSRSEPPDFTVYGDDIICRTSSAFEVVKLLKYAGFRLNLDKSFLQGPFRESCGADWYAGRDVRPLILDYELDSFQSIVKFHNSSLSKPYWQEWFSEIRRELWGAVPPDVRLCRPYKGTEQSAFEVELDVFMQSPFARWNRSIRSWSWVELQDQSISDKGMDGKPEFPAVLTYAALRGTESSCPFAFRRKTRQLVRRVAHSEAHSLWLPPMSV